MLRVAAAAARCRAGAERRAGPVPGPLRSGLGRASQGAASLPFLKTAFRLSSPPKLFSFSSSIRSLEKQEKRVVRYCDNTQVTYTENRITVWEQQIVAIAVLLTRSRIF